MYKMEKISLLIPMLVTILFISEPAAGQPAMPETLQSGTLREQLDYIQERTRIYDNFRAIREDMFQKVKNNSLDSLAAAKSEITGLSGQLESRDADIDSLGILLEDARDEMRLAVRNRDSIGFLGIAMHKTGYNMLVWIIIAGLSFLLVLGFGIFRRNRNLMYKALEDIDELKEEFEGYKKRSRDLREKLVIEHFNEIKKLREN